MRTHTQPHEHKQTGEGNVSLVYPSMKSRRTQRCSALLEPRDRAPFQQTALTHGFAVKLPRATVVVVRGPKACKHQTTMSRLTRVHTSVIQALFTALFPQAAELHWKTMRFLCITPSLSSRALLGQAEGIVKLQTGGRGKKIVCMNSVECSPVRQRQGFEEFCVVQHQKERKCTAKPLSPNMMHRSATQRYISSEKSHEAL